MNTETQKVDVLAALVSLMSHGGMLSPRRVIAAWNVPRSTGLVANRVRYLSPLVGGRSIAKTPTTATVLRALQRAERDGLVVCVGTGAQHDRTWNKSAANERERYWQLTDAALDRVGGEA